VANSVFRLKSGVDHLACLVRPATVRVSYRSFVAFLVWNLLVSAWQLAGDQHIEYTLTRKIQDGGGTWQRSNARYSIAINHG
jgi:hypothetical protein